ncbi:MAG: hypothetical protein IPM91_22480 [Bacteroidetes bacterium]|nr:hypothetical protein [Bacteroidota bacterium]
MKFTIFHFKNSGLAIFLFLFLFLHAGAQPLYFNWAKQVTGISISKNTLCDAVGNVYLIGRFNGTVDMDPSAAIYNLTSNGGSDVFIVKYSPGGNFLWAVQFSSLGIDDGYDLGSMAPGISLLRVIISLPLILIRACRSTIELQQEVKMFL